MLLWLTPDVSVNTIESLSQEYTEEIFGKAFIQSIITICDLFKRPPGQR